MDFTYAELDAFIFLTTEVKLNSFEKTELDKLTDRIIFRLENLKGGFLYCSRLEMNNYGNISDIIQLRKENSKWSIPTVNELKSLVEINTIQFSNGEYWAKDENNYYVLYDIKTGRTLNDVTHNSYLDFDGGDFSTFTPFDELTARIKLVRRFS
jgi:hypothetical protein